MDNLEPKIPIAIAVNEKYNQLLLSHPGFEKTATITGVSFPVGLKIIVLNNMDDGCLPLYHEADITRAFDANESFRKKLGITFIKWLNLCNLSLKYPN